MHDGSSRSKTQTQDTDPREFRPRTRSWRRQLRELELATPEGGSLTACSNADGSQYLRWAAPPRMMFGVVSNTPRTRRWLKLTLERFEKETAK